MSGRPVFPNHGQRPKQIDRSRPYSHVVQMSIERSFDISFVAALALKEKQIQQNYRPIIAVHKWFARRPGALFRALTLAEFSDEPIETAFYKANDFPGRTIADPFMGGGTPLLEANRVGCDVIGLDINPMSAWIVREEIEHLDLAAYEAAASTLLKSLKQDVGRYYRTDCPRYGVEDVPVKYFLWVKVIQCYACGKDFDLFPGYRLAKNVRHPKDVLVCSECGELNEVADVRKPGGCRACRARLRFDGPAKRNRCACPHCGVVNSYPRPSVGPPRHRLFAIEYHCPDHKAEHRGRFFKKPDAKDFENVKAAAKHWARIEPEFVPDERILPGDETNRLHRWGYDCYRDLFNLRQLLGLEVSCRFICAVENERVRHALATNLSDLLRYQNMLCRYDPMALKSLDIFSIHGFPVGLIQCESNLLGIPKAGGGNVGSGGWSNIVEKYFKAKQYCSEPFELRLEGSRKTLVPITGEWIGEKLDGARRRRVEIRCASSTVAELRPQSLDAVFTDPPYLGNVQYGELMDFCYVWLRRLVSNEAEGFDRPSARSPDELTGNATQGRGLEHFTEGISAVYRSMAQALKPGAPLAFTFHHNRFEAYCAIGVAILDAGLTCSASLPCPAEMGGSIHIHGTKSSIVDTILVCRSSGSMPRRWLFESPSQLAEIVADDLARLRAASVNPTEGDARCIINGHLTRMAIWNLRSDWNPDQPTVEKIDRFARAVATLGHTATVLELLDTPLRGLAESQQQFSDARTGLEAHDAVSF